MTLWDSGATPTPAIGYTGREMGGTTAAPSAQQILPRPRDCRRERGGGNWWLAFAPSSIFLLSYRAAQP